MRVQEGSSQPRFTQCISFIPRCDQSQPHFHLTTTVYGVHSVLTKIEIVIWRNFTLLWNFTFWWNPLANELSKCVSDFCWPGDQMINVLGTTNSWMLIHSLVPRPFLFCSLVCVQYNRQKWKSVKNGEGLGTTHHVNDVRWTQSGCGGGVTFK